jgi:hypothetical protein
MKSLLYPYRLLAVALATSCLQLEAALWENPVEEADGWKRISWYGWIHEGGNGWIYHAEHGWTYAMGADEDSIWFYDREMGWAWSGHLVYPYYYAAGAMDWLYFQTGSANPRFFRSSTTASWIEVLRAPLAAPERYPGNYGWRHSIFTQTEEHELLSWTPGARNTVVTDFDTHIVENDLLRITLLPNWGARILSIYYKPQDIELLSYAKGDKYSEVIQAPGAFYYDDWLLLPGGINPTFPEGEHGKYWGEVWAFQSMEETADHVTVRMSRTDDIDWWGAPEKFNNGLTGMSVDMDITIRRNRACVEIDYTLTNNKDETIAYEFWMAASLAPLRPEETHTSSNLEIIMKQEKIVLRDWWNWMKSVETDDETPFDDVYRFDKLAWLYNWQRSGIAYAYPLMDNSWWGVINHDYNWGVLRTADDPSISPGMKIWATGADYGMFELWSGNSSEFFDDAFLAPLEVKTWTEYFIPTVGLSAISHANSHGAAEAKVNVGGLTGSVELALFSTWQPANWKVLVQAVPVSGDPVELGTALLDFSAEFPAHALLLPFPMEQLPQEAFRIEAIVTDYFTGAERMRFDIDY